MKKYAEKALQAEWRVSAKAQNGDKLGVLKNRADQDNWVLVGKWWNQKVQGLVDQDTECKGK